MIITQSTTATLYSSKIFIIFIFNYRSEIIQEHLTAYLILTDPHNLSDGGHTSCCMIFADCHHSYPVHWGPFLMCHLMRVVPEVFTEDKLVMNLKDSDIDCNNISDPHNLSDAGHTSCCMIFADCHHSYPVRWGPFLMCHPMRVVPDVPSDEGRSWCPIQ